MGCSDNDCIHHDQRLRAIDAIQAHHLVCLKVITGQTPLVSQILNPDKTKNNLNITLNIMRVEYLSLVGVGLQKLRTSSGDSDKMPDKGSPYEL